MVLLICTEAQCPFYTGGRHNSQRNSFNIVEARTNAGVYKATTRLQKQYPLGMYRRNVLGAKVDSPAA